MTNWKNLDEVKAKKRAYNQRPEVKAKIKAYHQRPEVRERHNKYNREVYSKRPEVKARLRLYNQRPEIKARLKVYNQSPIVKAKKRLYNQRPDIKERNRLKNRNSYLYIPGGTGKGSPTRIYTDGFTLMFKKMLPDMMNKAAIKLLNEKEQLCPECGKSESKCHCQENDGHCFER